MIIALAMAASLAAQPPAPSPQRVVIGPPPAPPAPPAPVALFPHVISNPDWLRLPDGDALAEYYPPIAVERHVDGRTRMQCEVTAEGRLTGCFIVDEAPAEYGFGRATIHAARFFLMRSKTVDGAPVAGGKVIVPMAWGMALDEGFGVTPPTLDPPPTVPAGRPRVTVGWVASPAYADLEALFPQQAAARMVGGEAEMRCRVEADGGLSGCAVTAEYPSGYGLGEATLALAGKYRLGATTSAGGPTAGLFVTTTVIWSQSQRRMAHFYDKAPPK